jgi:putative zinc finger/helix-turn-helix YgiT family protein
MKCINCGHAMTSTRGTHRYTESGLSNVTLANIEIRTCSECGEREVVIPKMEILHRMIARNLIKVPRLLPPEEIRFLRKWLGLSGLDFALVMGVRPETVSRWEHKDGKNPISPTADRLLRLLVANQAPVERYPIDLFKLKPHARPVAIKLKAPDWKEATA